MATPRKHGFLPSVSRIRRILNVAAITTINIHKCMNGLEKYMLVPSNLDPHSYGGSYGYFEGEDEPFDDNDEWDDTPRVRPHWDQFSDRDKNLATENLPELALEADDVMELESAIAPIENTRQITEEWQEEPIESQFAPIGSQNHRYVSQHMGGPLAEHIIDEPAYFYLWTTYISYMILTFIGHTRDFFGKRFKAKKYKDFKDQDGYAALNSDYDNFYFRRLKKRMNDCFMRPITGVPGRYITLIDRISHDYNETFNFTGTLTTTLNLSSYNYLGFAQSSGPCADDAHAAITTYGISSASPRLDSGTSDLAIEVEREIANFVGKEDAMIFSMGFSTNATSFPTLVGPGCLIISDELNHASIRVGARLSRAVIKSYKHNDMKDLERLLREAISQGQPRTHKPWRKILVVCEGLFSMEGTIADLPNIVRLKKKYKFYLFVDEAHSIGALGPRGRGVCDYFSIDPAEVDILMGTFTKSFGANGGYVAASKSIIQTLRSTNAAMLYGESTAPPVLMQILSSLRQITSTAVGLERLQRITFNSRYLRLGLKRLGFIVYGHDDSPVVPMMLYHPGKLPAFSREMLKRGISVVIAGYPATPLLTARVRLCVSASHNKEDMDRVLRACNEISELLDLKFSTGIAGGIEPLPEGVMLADVQGENGDRKGKGKVVVKPRWKLEDVMEHGVRDAKLQLSKGGVRAGTTSYLSQSIRLHLKRRLLLHINRYNPAFSNYSIAQHKPSTAYVFFKRTVMLDSLLTQAAALTDTGWRVKAGAFVTLLFTIFAATKLITSIRSSLAVSTKSKSSPPLAPYSIPFLGNLVVFAFDTKAFLDGLRKKFGTGTPVRIRLGNRIIHYISGPDSVLSLFRKSRDLSTAPSVIMVLENAFAVPPKHRRIFERDTTGVFSQPAAGSPPIEPENRYWHLNHKVLQEGLIGPSLEFLAKLFISNLESELMKLDIGEEWTSVPDIYELIRQTCFKASITALCGKHMFELNPNFGNDFWDLDDNVINLFKGIPQWLDPGAYRARDRYISSVKKWHRFSREHADCQDEKFTDVEWDEYYGSKVMRLRAKEFGGIEGMDADGLAGLDGGMIWAANANIVPAIGWCIIDGLLRPPLLSRIRDEISKAPPPSDPKTSLNMPFLLSSTLLQCIWSEELRLRGSVAIQRTPMIPTFKIGPWNLAQDQLILASSWHEHHDPSIWNEGPTAASPDFHSVDTFWPERFLQYPEDPLSGPRKPCSSSAAKPAPKTEKTEKGEPKFTLEPVNGSFIPFGGGQKVCPGRFYAKQEAIGGMTLFLSLFDIELDDYLMKKLPEMDMRYFAFGVIPPLGKFPGRMRRRKVD
ncbi:hypothetical protein G7Y89_g14024 [Cudoniella acicularis]|uniref:Aminotransferase class I/classII large domain-containing protein n=1 Tax=Cudoniella acicularis TaxID=354080 RepID=A0A8H4VY40_9HELO|nr:hypothetical protein G7Y89_g14024 [Cudoniella acicularis]